MHKYKILIHKTQASNILKLITICLRLIFNNQTKKKACKQKFNQDGVNIFI